GTIELRVVNGVFTIQLRDGTLKFFGLGSVAISGSFTVGSNGAVHFNFTGSLSLDLTDSGYGLDGGLNLTITDASLAGKGSVHLEISGTSVASASASLTLNWSTGAWSIHADGPLG